MPAALESSSVHLRLNARIAGRALQSDHFRLTNYHFWADLHPRVFREGCSAGLRPALCGNEMSCARSAVEESRQLVLAQKSIHPGAGAGSNRGMVFKINSKGAKQWVPVMVRQRLRTISALYFTEVTAWQRRTLLVHRKEDFAGSVGGSDVVAVS